MHNFYGDGLGKRMSQTKNYPIWRLQKNCVLWVSSIEKSCIAWTCFYPRKKFVLSTPDLSLRLSIKRCCRLRQVEAGSCAKWCYLLALIHLNCQQNSVKFVDFWSAWTPHKNCFAHRHQVWALLCIFAGAWIQLTQKTKEFPTATSTTPAMLQPSQATSYLAEPWQE